MAYDLDVRKAAKTGIDPLPGLGAPAKKPSPLRAAFGLTEGAPDASGDAAARARILSAPAAQGGYLDVLPSERDRNDYNEGPEGRDPANRVIPTRAESAREDAYLNQQIQTSEDQDARRRAAIQEADELNARYRRQAAEQAFYDRTGLPYDEKMAEKLREYDQQTAEEVGLADDIGNIEADRDAELAEVTKKRDAELATLPPARNDAEKELNRQRFNQIDGKYNVSGLTEKWNRKIAERLWMYGARRGVNVGNPIPKGTDPNAIVLPSSGASSQQ